MPPYDWIPPESVNCRGEDPDIWFPSTRRDMYRAIRICQSCPVREKCLKVGVDRGEWGVWGGVPLRGGKESRFPFYRQNVA